MKTFILILLLFAGLTVSGQEDDKHQRIKALKVAFLTEKLELTPDEASKFWPIYNMYDDKMHELRKRERKLFKEKYTRDGSKNDLSDAEAKNIIQEYDAVLNERNRLEKKRMDDLLKELPASKIVYLPEVERQFGKKLFEEYKKRKRQNDSNK